MIALEKKEEHFESSEIVRDIVIGMADGLTVPFALAAGLSGALSADANSIIITAGLAEIVAGSIAMGLGGYLAGKNEIDHFDAELKREYFEVDHFPEKEKEEIKEIFADYGLSDSAQDTIVEELSKDKDKWVQFMMRYELGLERPDPKRAQKSALYIASSYILGGFIPLSAYFFTNNTQKGLLISSIMTIISLGIFGYFKTKIVGQPPIKGALKTILIGTVAAAAAFGIAKAIGG